MRYTVTKKIGPISVMHAIVGLPEGHPCRNMHGHNLYVELAIGADQLIRPGFVVDFNDLEPVESYLKSWSRLDSLAVLFPSGRDATVEHLAEHVADWYTEQIQPKTSGRLLSVTVHENDTCSATFTVPVALGATR
ncbi:6-pyruvoyl tetrahydropterin synthase family protein [Streptomyces sp. NPDC056486]|uniref:6-pyruvoyl trahydropterin synthase family protein n=1 Tax=Streptomyces sp. NPDC056486 TaxID=3345835 RepID=UPI0036B7D324